MRTAAQDVARDRNLRAAHIWLREARDWDRATHRHGRHGGIIGRSALAVYLVLVAEQLRSDTPNIELRYPAIAEKTGYSRNTIPVAIGRLCELGMVRSWVRGPMGCGFELLSPARWRRDAERPLTAAE